MLLNEQTGDVIRFTTLEDIPGGTWLLRQPFRKHRAGGLSYVTARVVQRRPDACLLTLRPSVLLSFLGSAVSLDHPIANVSTQTTACPDQRSADDRKTNPYSSARHTSENIG